MLTRNLLTLLNIEGVSSDIMSRWAKTWCRQQWLQSCGINLAHLPVCVATPPRGMSNVHEFPSFSLNNSSLRSFQIARLSLDLATMWLAEGRTCSTAL